MSSIKRGQRAVEDTSALGALLNERLRAAIVGAHEQLDREIVSTVRSGWRGDLWIERPTPTLDDDAKHATIAFRLYRCRVGEQPWPRLNSESQWQFARIDDATAAQIEAFAVERGL